MTANVGVRWQEGELEVGFSAGSLEEFNEHMAKVRAVVELCWPDQAPRSDSNVLGMDQPDLFVRQGLK